MAGPIQSAAGRATVAMGALSGKIVNTVMQMTGDSLSNKDAQVTQGSDTQQSSYSNAEIEKQAEANRISIEHVKSKQHQQGEFAKRLGAVGTGGEQ